MNLMFLRNRKFLISLIVILCFSGGLLAGFLQSKSTSGSNTPLTPVDIAANTGNNAEVDGAKTIPTPPPDIDSLLETNTVKVSADSKHLSVLMLGYGGAGHDGGYLTDTIILAYLDVVKKKLVLIHIPRDVWVDVRVGNSTMPMKINGALAMGTKTSNYPTTTVSKDSVLRASTLTKQAATTITGLPVDFVMGVDFFGFSQAINSIKGIDVEVPATFDDSWYPVRGRELELCGHTPEEVTQLSNTLNGFALEKQFPCRYEQLHFEKGVNHMDGDTALKYGRSRHSSSDFARGIRQIAVLRATVKKLFTLNALSNIKEFHTSLTKSVKTDISVDQLNTIAPILKTIPDLEVVEIGLDTTNVLISGTAKSGAFILIPKDGEGNWQGTKNFISSKL